MAAVSPSAGVAALLVPAGALSVPGSPGPATPIAIPSKGAAPPGSPLSRLIRVPSFSSLHLRRSPAASPTTECAPPDWSSAGMASLPPDPRLTLLDVGSAPDTYLGSPSPSPSYASASSSSLDRLGRQIPSSVPFVLEWSGDVPTTTSFDISTLSAALLQPGEYTLTLAWRGESGQMQDLAAAKGVQVAMGKRVLGRSETNTLRFVKPDGPAIVTVNKERWWQAKRKERTQQYRWTIDYRPPHLIRESPAEYGSNEYFASPPHYDASPSKPDQLSIPIVQAGHLTPGRHSPYRSASPDYSSEEDDAGFSSESDSENGAAARARIDIKIHHAPIEPLPHGRGHLPAHSGPA